MCHVPCGCFEARSLLLPLPESLASLFRFSLACFYQFKDPALCHAGFFPSYFLFVFVVDVVEDEGDRCTGQLNSLLIHEARLCHSCFNWQCDQRMNPLAVFPFFRWVKCQPHAGSHVQCICSCFPLLLLFHCRVLQANSIWRGYFLLPEKCFILLPRFLFPSFSHFDLSNPVPLRNQTVWNMKIAWVIIGEMVRLTKPMEIALTSTYSHYLIFNDKCN